MVWAKASLLFFCRTLESAWRDVYFSLGIEKYPNSEIFGEVNKVVVLWQMTTEVQNAFKAGLSSYLIIDFDTDLGIGFSVGIDFSIPWFWFWLILALVLILAFYGKPVLLCKLEKGRKHFFKNKQKAVLGQMRHTMRWDEGEDFILQPHLLSSVHWLCSHEGCQGQTLVLPN